jgi:diguanylate cyclase (GGDEF)-like protein
MVSAGVGLAAVAAHRTVPTSPVVVGAAIALAVAFYAVEITPLHLEWSGQAYSITLSEVPLVVGLLIWPSLAVVIARVVGGGAALLFHRRQPLEKLAYNVSMQFLESTCALAVFLLVPHFAGPQPLGSAPAVLAATICSTGTAIVFVWLAIRIRVGHLDRRVVKSFTSSALAGVIINPSIALVMVAATTRSPAMTVPLAVVAIGSAAIYRAYVGLRARHANLAAVYDFTRGFSQSETSEGWLCDLLVKTRHMLRAGTAGLVLVGDDEPALSRWVDHDGVLHTGRIDPTGADWPFALVLTAGSAMTMPRGSRTTGHQSFLDRRMARDAVLVPLRVDGQVNGVLFVQDRAGDVATFTDEDGRLLETLATHAASLLDNNRLVDRLRHESRHDALTGLANRNYFRTQLEAALNAPDPHLALLLADLDRFKEINDTLGHHHGDLLLREVARRIRRSAPATAVVARLGGDEFALLLQTDDEVEVVEIANTIRNAMAAPCVLDGLGIDIDGSFGIAFAPLHGDEESVLLKRADMAMYAAKSAGSGVEIYDNERDEYSPRRLALATELRAAIARNELVLHYQPQINDTGAVCGVEALVRWQHPRFDTVTPDEFIPLAEHSGAIIPLTRWVLREALQQQLAWHRRGWPLSMSVNVSLRDLLDSGIVDCIRQELRRFRIAPHMLTLEITESHIMGDSMRALPVLERLASLGVRLSIDDFGTGYSSLSCLRQFPVDEIKIDKAFVSDLGNQDNCAIVKAIVGIADSLNVDVVAEGVELSEAVDVLSDMGCSRLQGYYVARPMSADAFADWVQDHQPRVPLAAVRLPRQLSAAQGAAIG